jgi:carbonic anhydrase
MKTSIKNTLFILSFFAIISCQNTVEQKESHHESTLSHETGSTLVGHVLDATDQAQLIPDMVLSTLQNGNGRFVDNELTPRDYPLQAENSANGQYPMAVILSCIDSRVPVEQVFDLGIGDVFVARVAGNIVNEDILGSMEYSCKVSGSKLVVVMGHESCGAVKAAIDQVELGNITPLLDKIQPAVADAQSFEGEKTTSNKAFVDHVGELNVLESMAQIRRDSPILKAMEDNGEIKIVGAFYNLHTGKVEFLEEE